jgi:hypothetical protein
VLRGVRYRLEAECYQRRPCAEQARALQNGNVAYARLPPARPCRSVIGLTSASDSEYRGRALPAYRRDGSPHPERSRRAARWHVDRPAARKAMRSWEI